MKGQPMNLENLLDTRPIVAVKVELFRPQEEAGSGVAQVFTFSTVAQAETFALGIIKAATKSADKLHKEGTK